MCSLRITSSVRPARAIRQGTGNAILQMHNWQAVSRARQACSRMPTIITRKRAPKPRMRTCQTRKCASYSRESAQKTHIPPGNPHKIGGNSHKVAYSTIKIPIKRSKIGSTNTNFPDIAFQIPCYCSACLNAKILILKQIVQVRRLLLPSNSENFPVLNR